MVYCQSVTNVYAFIRYYRKTKILYGGTKMSTLTIVFSIMLLVCAVALVLIILFQAGRDASMSGAITGGSSNFYSKNKRATREELMKRLTVIVSIIFMVIVFLLNIFEIAA